jgi:hypothetical protein
MRQQLLAREMEMVGKEADTVSLLHLSPRANHDSARITSPNLHDWSAKEFPGENREVTEVWRHLVKPLDRFQHVAVEEFFSPALGAIDSDLSAWRAYIKSRYAWVVG